MKPTEMSKWVVSVLIGICMVHSVVGDATPVFLWTNQRSFPDVSVPAGQHMSNPDFNRHITSHLVNKAKGNIIAFLQDKLSLNDITKYADVYSENSNGHLFHNLKKYLEDHKSLELPSVHDVDSALQELASTFQGPVHYLSAPYDISKLSLDGNQRHLVLVSLPDTQEDEKMALEKNNEILGRLNSQIQKLGKPYTALYTGKQSSKVGPVESLYMGRHLLQTASKPAVKSVFLNYSDCMYVYMKGLKVEVMAKSKVGENEVYVPVYTRKLVQDEGVKFSYDNTMPCGNKTAKLQFSASDNQSIIKFVVTMDFKIDRSGWTLDILNLDYEIKNGTTTYRPENPLMDTSNIGAAKGFSYHCTDLTPVKPINISATKPYARLTFKDLQMQVERAPIRNRKFGNADDCVGFFTIPIWSGIITAIILTSILAFGIVMIMNISTMDRFDDPKGKTITVNVAD